MHVLCILSTKGGVGKTTVAANLGGILADAGKRVLLLDLDSQPTLSSYFSLATEAPGGIYELIALNDCRPEQVVSRTLIPDLDLILSNDDQGKLATLLLHAPDGRLSLTLVDSIAPAGIDLLIDPAFKNSLKRRTSSMDPGNRL